ncbi:hypothetical protein [Peristeroidobacter soli]|jgi:hypothetical protein|uniref:hypothetical protein n=1 Tax=Peristeroidobacter soli TaxID=2497877 RepID=UPI00101C931E|nr:hypothetical protein [Peristeroidobacter soli]
MKQAYGDAQYTSSPVEDQEQGFGGYELRRLREGREDRVATVLFWDATGQFFVETFGDVPLVILEALIAEAKSSITVR